MGTSVVAQSRPGLTALAVLVSVIGSAGRVARAEDRLPPLIVHEPCEVYARGRAFVIQARFLDDSKLFDPSVIYRNGNRALWKSVPFAAHGSQGDFSATIEASALSGSLEYFIQVFDELGNGPARYGSVDAPVVVRPSRDPPPCRQVPLLEAKTTVPVATSAEAAGPATPPGASDSQPRWWSSAGEELLRLRLAVGVEAGPMVNADDVLLGAGAAVGVFGVWRWVELGAGYVYPRTFTGAVRLWAIREPIEAGLVARYSAYARTVSGPAGQFGQGVGVGACVGYALPLPRWSNVVAGVRLEYVYSYDRAAYAKGASAAPVLLAAFARFGG